MKVLLTGATGLLGRHIVSELLRQGIVPRLLLHRHTFARNALPVETEIFWGNLSDPSCVDAILSGVDAVIHCAWAFNGANTPRPTVNEVSSRDLCERALRKGVTKFAFVSSVAVYGMSGNGGTVCSEISELCGEKEPFIYPQEKVSVEKQL